MYVCMYIYIYIDACMYDYIHIYKKKIYIYIYTHKIYLCRHGFPSSREDVPGKALLVPASSPAWFGPDWPGALGACPELLEGSLPRCPDT